MSKIREVAVLMSTYNGEQYIREQINSILSQTGDFKLYLYVRDDGSTDLTTSILEEYENNGCLRWYGGENLGPAKSFIDLIKKTPEYDFYAFADQDDFWMKNKIENALNELSNNKIQCIYFSNAYIADEKLNSINKMVYGFQPSLDLKTLSCYGGILGCTMVFNLEMAKIIRNAPMPNKLIMHDFYLAEVCLALNGKLIFDERPTMKYRQHGNNTVGVPTNPLNKIKNRVGILLHIYKESIAEQAKEICDLYGVEISAENMEWLEQVSCYRDCLLNRIRLATTCKVKYPRINLGLITRLSILLGNR